MKNENGQKELLGIFAIFRSENDFKTMSRPS
jgi:hypothetical protein